MNENFNITNEVDRTNLYNNVGIKSIKEVDGGWELVLVNGMVAFLPQKQGHMFFNKVESQDEDVT